ncbi:MAG: hypothetical protein Q9166_006173, partial [cf. Caloplaca sp. 2 TL-2023]
ASLPLDPAPPPDLYVKVDFKDYLFEALQVWHEVVAAGFVLAQYPGDQQDVGVGVLHAHFFRTVISKALFLVFPYGQCTYSTNVWALWALGRHIIQHYPNLAPVPAFSSVINPNGNFQGNIDLFKPGSEAVELNDVDNTTNIASVLQSKDQITSPLLRANSSRFTTHEDPNLSIVFRFLGQRLIPDQVFTAFLSSNNFFSEHDGEERNVSMVAFSSDRTVRLGITGVGPSRPGANQLQWNLARIAANGIWWNLVMGYQPEPEVLVPRWEAMTFKLEYNGVRIGQGFLR